MKVNGGANNPIGVGTQLRIVAVLRELGARDVVLPRQQLAERDGGIGGRRGDDLARRFGSTGQRLFANQPA